MGHCRAMFRFCLEEMYFFIVSYSMMTHQSQERHMVYEYWVSASTENGEGGSPNMERETAELIQPLVCNTNKNMD